MHNFTYVQNPLSMPVCFIAIHRYFHFRFITLKINGRDFKSNFNFIKLYLTHVI